MKLMIVFYLPAMVANGSPTLVRKGTPIDLGLKAWDGRRLFGNHKTFEGLLVGLTFGAIIALDEHILGLLPFRYGLASSAGALLGDLVGAFIKRRLGIESGAPAPLLDQWDFVLGATAAMMLLGCRIPLECFVLALIVMFCLHRLTNYVAYKLGIKAVPW